MMSVPIWITDRFGNLIYFNEPTEELIGLRFDETGDLPASTLTDLFNLCDLNGSPIPDAERPLMIALEKLQPAQRAIRMNDAEGREKVVADTAIPIVGE